MAQRRTMSGGFFAGLAPAAILVWSSTAMAAEGEQTTPSFGDLGQAIATLVIFVLLLTVLGRFAWKPLLAQLRRREESIAEALRRSQEREAQSEELLKAYQARLEAAEAEAAEVVARGRKAAAESREQVLSAARDEAGRTMTQAKEEIDQAKEAAVRDLYAAAADLATDVAERVIGKSLKDADHARLVDESLGQIRRQRGGKET
ncbi:MAG: F0F1 ATP synthase subunit B [Alphaproteobacteria bacterium]